METTNVTLLERLKSPADDQAWGRFVDLYTPLIYAVARRGGLQEADAADLVQDVFALLVRKMSGFRHDGRSFRDWLRTVTLNVLRDRCRRQAARGAAITGGVSADMVVARSDESFTEIEYRRYLVGRALELMQAEFQPTTWKACWEFVVAGRPAAEVAKEFGISENAVFLAKGRVLRRLRRDLAGLLDW